MYWLTVFVCFVRWSFRVPTAETYIGGVVTTAVVSAIVMILKAPRATIEAELHHICLLLFAWWMQKIGAISPMPGTSGAPRFWRFVVQYSMHLRGGSGTVFYRGIQADLLHTSFV